MENGEKVIGHYTSERTEGSHVLTDVWVCVGRTQEIRARIADSDWHPTDADAKARVIGRWEWLHAEGYRLLFDWNFSAATGFTAKYQEGVGSGYGPFLTNITFHGRTIVEYTRGLALLRTMRVEKRGPYDSCEAIPPTPKALLERIDRFRNVDIMWPDQGREPRWSDWVVKTSGPIRSDGSAARARALPKAVAV